MTREDWEQKAVEGLQLFLQEGGITEGTAELAEDFLKGAEAGAEVNSSNVGRGG